MKWGLPVQFSAFDELISQIKNLRAQNPSFEFHLLSAHQGEWEAEKVREVLAGATETIYLPEEFASLWPSPHPVHVFRVKIA